GDPTNPALRQAAVGSVLAVGVAYDDATLVSDVDVIHRSQVTAYIEALAPGLDVTGKERFVADLVRVAWAGGTLSAAQRGIVDSVGRSLRLTPADVGAHALNLS